MLNKKIYFIILLSALLTNTICGQSTFNNYYQSGSKSLGSKIQYINSSDFVLNSIWTDSASGQQGMDLRLINNNGVSLNHKRYLFKDLDFLTYLQSNMQWNVSGVNAITSAAAYTNSNVSVFIYTSFNKHSLDTNWVRYYSDGIYKYSLPNTFRVKLNEIWCFGSRMDNNGIQVKPFALKIDTLGNVLGTKAFTNLNNYSYCVAYFDTLTKLIYLGATNFTIPQSETNHIVCIDTIGNVLWNQQFTGLEFASLEKRGNYLLVACSKFINVNGSFNQNKLCLTKLDCSNNGTVIWQKVYAKEGSLSRFERFVINPDESIVATGSYKQPNVITGPVNDGVIMKANSNGDSLWMRTFSNCGDNCTEIFYDIQKCDDEGYVMCGVPHYDVNSRSWVVKTDSLGFAPGAITTHIEKIQIEELKWMIYPNPASDKLTLEADYNSNSNVKLINALGQVVLNEPIIETKSTLDISYLSEGIYQLVISNSEGRSYSKKLIIRK